MTNNTNHILILGAGGTSREIVTLIAQVPGLVLDGFLDDDPNKLGKLVDGFPVLGPLSDAKQHSSSLIIGVSSSTNRAARQRIVERLELPGSRFATLVHPLARIAPTGTVGAGSVIFPNVEAGPGVKIGAHVVVLSMTFIGHDTVVEDYCTFGSGVIINSVCQIGRATYIGAGAILRPAIRTAPESLVGMGSVVMANVDGGTVFGNPARPLTTGLSGRTSS